MRRGKKPARDAKESGAPFRAMALSAHVSRGLQGLVRESTLSLTPIV
jgi:hypothetical protein